MSAKYQYRHDIDGLRALAVLPVLLFHAQLGCPGGFVGVDVFFVISGYLISALILRELHAGTFNLVTFWERRVRRILPALTVVVLATFFAGWLIYLPQDFESVGNSIVAQAILVSNVFFYLQPDGYFDAGIDTKPLLHTWSLAVEEQFYLFFPLLLMVLARTKKLSQVKTISILGLASFALSVYGSYAYTSATFYLLPTRAWELLIGTFLAMMHGRFPGSQLTRESTGLVGLALVCFPMFLYHEGTRFPGLAAVPPCVGAALIIYSSELKRSFVGRLLAFKPIVFVGLISYSLYLWHWPVLVVSHYLAGDQKWPFRLALLMVGTALALISWKFIETPFRKQQIFPRRSSIFGFAAVSLAALLILGFVVDYGDGLPSRFSENALRYASGRNDHAFRKETSLEQARAGDFVELGSGTADQQISVLIWGDSHAMGVTPVIDDLCRQFSRRGIQVAQHGVPPLLRGASPSPVASSSLGDAVLSFVIERNIRNVIITGHWKFYAKSDSFKSHLVSTVDTLLASGVRVYLLKDVPDQGFDVPRVAALVSKYGGDVDQLGISSEKHATANSKLAQTFEKISQMGATVLDPAEYFLNSKGLYGAVRNNQALYTDGNHLTVAGARLLLSLFQPIFQNQQ